MILFYLSTSFHVQGIERLARLRDMETIYLHVDVNNHVACDMYRKAGFEITDKHDPIFREFTVSLNLQDGVTNGRSHHLLYKNLSTTQTWIDISSTIQNKAILGFEV